MMTLKFKFVLFFLIGVFVFLGAADVSFADSNCYWGCNSSEFRCQGVDDNGEPSNCDWTCNNQTLICVDPEHGSAICNLEVGCPNPVFKCLGIDANGEGSNCDWYCPAGSGSVCDDSGGAGGGGGNCIPDGGSCIGQPGSACCSGICDVRDREGEERADVCVGSPTPPPPSVDINTNPSTVNWNQSSTLSWGSSNASSCNASGDWSGSKPVNGSESTGNLGQVRTYNYGLTCSGTGGSASDTASVVVNAPIPVVSSVSAAQPDYCISGPAATVNWSYSDPSGSPQQSYQVQIDNEGSFGSPEVDSGKVNSGSTSYYSGQGSLQFNTTYKARVRVWNSYDAVSDWTVSGSFKTPEFAYPQVNFTWSVGGINEPPSPPKGSQIQFSDRTVFQGNQNQREWDWNFGDSTASTQQNPIKMYGNLGTYYLTLTATDSRSQTCSRTKGPLNVQKSVPKWKEVAPR